MGGQEVSEEMLHWSHQDCGDQGSSTAIAEPDFWADGWTREWRTSKSTEARAGFGHRSWRRCEKWDEVLSTTRSSASRRRSQLKTVPIEDSPNWSPNFNWDRATCPWIWSHCEQRQRMIHVLVGNWNCPGQLHEEKFLWTILMTLLKQTN